jgi:hypothetical protein
MISLLKFIIWITGAVVVATFALGFFGYELNRDYFQESKAVCLEKLADCKNEYIQQGTENAQCRFDCVDPKLIIKKTSSEITSDRES